MTRRNVLSTWKQLLAIVAALLTGTIAYAQQPGAAPDDPPVRVGRLSYINGDVSYALAGNDEWVSAQINRPIVTGDRVWADNNGRAEITVDNSAWWLGESTSVTVSNLDDRISQFQLQQGTLDFRVRSLPSGNIVEVDTPNLAFTVTRPGRYRVVVDPQAGGTTVVVRSGGGGEVYGENASYVVASGQAYRFYGNDLSDSELVSLPPADAFDRFVAERDGRYDRVVSARYVSPEVVGYEDLDTYGSWNVEASYGNVWFPRAVQREWAPYRDGHWAWIDPWGWTWVDDQPWGFAPFHYGRWAHFNRGWGWIPGPRNVRPVYAPALVAFVGGSGFGISVSSGPAIGWFPLGPREYYRPPYRVSRNYFRQVNVSNTVVNTTNITNVYNNYSTNTNVSQVNYVNMRAPNGLTAVPPAAFAQSQNVRRAAVALPATAIQRAQVQSLARIAPARPALVGAAPVAQARPPAGVVQRSVVAKAAPPPPPIPDAQKLQALEKNPGQPLTRSQVQQLRQSAPVAARPVRVVEQPKPAANAAPPARSAGEGASRRAQQGPGAAPSAGAPAVPPGAPSAGSTAGRTTPPPTVSPPGQPPATAGTPGAGQARPGAATPGQPPGTAGGPGRPPGTAGAPGQARSATGAPGQPPVAGPGSSSATPVPKSPDAGGAPEAKGPPTERRSDSKGPPVARPPDSAADPRGPAGPASRATPQERAAPSTPPPARAPDTRPGPDADQGRGTQAMPQTRPPGTPPQAARPPSAAAPTERSAQPEGRPGTQPPPQRGPETRAAPQRSPEARPQPRPPEAQPQPRPPQAQPQPRPPQAQPQAPEARSQPRPPQAQPQPQPRPPQAQPQPQPRPPQAQPPQPRPPQAQPQPRPPQAQPQPRPEARGSQGGPPQGQAPARPQGNERDKGKDKDKDKDEKD